MQSNPDMKNKLYVKHFEDEDVNGMLVRIASYLENMYSVNKIYPKEISMLVDDYQRIKKERADVIKNNKILGMEIITREEEKKNDRFRKFNTRVSNRFNRISK